MKPRSAKSLGNDFPYRSDTLCYIEVLKTGEVQQGLAIEAYQRAKSGKSSLYAVWPGRWRSDLFLIDDLDELAKAIGIVSDPERTGLTQHAHKVKWQVSPYEDNPGASYISISLQLECGCEIKDFAEFAKQMREQQGWDVSTSGGWGSHGTPGGRASMEYSMRVRRKSLDDN